MPPARKVALRVNRLHVANARVRRSQEEPELVIAEPLIGEVVIDESFTVELLELVHPDEIRSGLPNGGWRKVPLRIFIALIRSGVVRVVEES